MSIKTIFGFICILILLRLTIKNLSNTKVNLITFLEQIYFLEVDIKKIHNFDHILNICKTHKFVKIKNKKYVLTEKGKKYYLMNKNSNFTNMLINLTLWFIALGNFFF